MPRAPGTKLPICTTLVVGDAEAIESVSVEAGRSTETFRFPFLPQRTCHLDERGCRAAVGSLSPGFQCEERAVLERDTSTDSVLACHN